MLTETYPVGIFQANCYLLSKDDSLIVIDPGANASKLISHIDNHTEKPLGILLTHGHFDHIGAVDDISKKYNIPVYLSQYDYKLAHDAELNSMHNRSATISVPLRDYPVGNLQLGPFEIEVIDTPGHTEGSVCLKIENCLFTGDTLFKNSVGRTDLYGGSEVKLRQSLEKLCSLDPDLLIYPGHSVSSVLYEEIRNNPYL